MSEQKLTKLGARRLLRLAKILDTADALHKKRGEPKYDQSYVLHDCGSPACAIGHWAYANRKRWKILKTGPNYAAIALKENPSGWAHKDIQRDFEIEMDSYGELFWSSGCGGARTAKQAAKYIRAFVKRKGVA